MAQTKTSIQPECIKLMGADIMLFEYSDREGKIVVAHPDFNFSYYWGSMGRPLKQFLKNINADYFAGKLIDSRDEREFDAKSTLTAVRRRIREEWRWWENMEFQKELREEIKALSDCQSENEFISRVQRIPDNLVYEGIEYRDQSSMQRRLEEVLDEPWYFTETKPSRRFKWLMNLHSELKNVL